MNRRSLLALIGLAPVASVAPVQALSGARFAAGGLVRGESYIVGQAASELAMPLRGEILTVNIDEGEIARAVRAQLARHGLFDQIDGPGFYDGDGI